LELKHLASQDALNKGQVVQESDLTDTALVERLRLDPKFRVAATHLLQRYGYLLPKSQAALGTEINHRGEIPQIPQNVDFPEGRTLQNSVTNARMIPSPAELTRDTSTPQFLSSPSMDSSVLSTATSRLTRNGTGDSDQDASLVGASSAGGINSLASTGLGIPTAALSNSTGANSTAGINSLANTGLGIPTVGMPDLGGADNSASSTSGASMTAAGMTQPAIQPPARERAPRPGSFQAQQLLESEMPGARSHKSPYSDLPSIYDMYVHAGQKNGQVQRFGDDIFENGTNLSGVPIDFPASPDYVVGPGDGLTINMWGGVSQRLESTVDHEGRISIPEIGPVFVSGKPLGEVQQAVQRELRTMFRSTSADVSLSKLRTIRIYVVGDVNGPGAFDVSSLSTPLNVLLAAGGPTSGGSMRLVKHFRGKTLVQDVDLYDLLLRGIRSDLKPLEPGDSLLVPPVGTEVRIDGMVRRPALYELNGETNLSQVIDLAGGILPTAALDHIEVQRLVAHEKRTMLSLEISGTSDPAEIEKKLAAFTISDRDEIHIFPIATFNQDAVYLQGHVQREGRYTYKPGMKLTDLVSSYADLLPEPATSYGEIIRLTPPDYRPTVESFNLGDVMANPSSSPKLEPLDTVRIFGKYDFEDLPSVTVTGAVRSPGVFETSGRIHFLDALKLAGGLTPDASMNSAQIIRPMPDSSVQILNVQLKEALNGDPINNVLLGPRDRILIQENIMRTDPRSVQIAGDVVNPGRYPVTSDLRISGLVRLAGGLKRGADENSADLTQFITAPNAPILAKHKNVSIAKAVTGDLENNISLNDGDILTIRDVPGWSDVGASITIDGEVKHPGTYGIQSGERLSSVLERAGGFQPDGYPYGAILKRTEIQVLEVKSRDELIMRVKNAQNDLELQPDTDPKAKTARAIASQQWESNIEELSSNAPVGRIAIRISGDINRWKDSPADIQLQAGDMLVIPKKPGVVLVTGQVFNPTAVAFRPGRSAKWYLTQAGGPTPLANKKSMFVIKADGSVIGGKNGLWSGDSLGAALQPGDMVVVPEKALSGNVPWQNILLSAQVASSMATAIMVALHY
jgi:protein involved in polysaccharide export with SLBB domain